MRGNSEPLCSSIQGPKTLYRVPVYQRKYSWGTANCDQLFNDLKRLTQLSSRDRHFFGSIVTAPDRIDPNSWLVIDGQQRLTTLSLLLLAAIKAQKDGKLEVNDSNLLKEVEETLLRAPYSRDDRHIKLVPVEQDREAYDKLFTQDKQQFVDGSRITTNYLHFYDLLTRNAKSLTFDELYDAVERLQIISIELEERDDAQLIFESLNSTGLALKEADKIRNYMLMSLPSLPQEHCFKNCWQKMEEKVGNIDRLEMFLRDYLTIRQQRQRPVRADQIYPEWKKYMEDKLRTEELAQMLVYANYYEQLAKCSLRSPRLSEKMSHIANLESDVANVFFIPFLKYADDHRLSDDEIYRVIDLVENYLARRIVCDLPTNAHTQVFCALHKDVLKSYEDYRRESGVECPYAYSDILAYHLQRREGKFQMPRDGQFRESVKTRDVYHMNKPSQIFLFERLENAVKGEYIDVAAEMKNKKATIEHIMPQTLSEDWKRMLGEKFEETHGCYLHTLANLTLTGINSELGNKPFATKRDGEDENGKNGYKSSKYRLTRWVSQCDKWGEKEMNERAAQLSQLLLTLYPWPKSDFRPIEKPVDEVSLDDETFSPAYRQLRGYRLFGEEYSGSVWKDMMLNVIREMMQREPEKMEDLFEREKLCFLHTPNPNYCTELSPGHYVWTSIDNVGKLNYLREMFEACGLDPGELTLHLVPAKSAE